MSNNQEKSTLHLIPCPIAENTNHLFSVHFLDLLFSFDFYITERARTTRRWLSSLKFPRPIDTLEILEMDKDNPGVHIEQVLNWLNQGKEVALISEAGTPCIADPGNLYVAAAHKSGHIIKPYVGPNSLILALMASGFNGQQFVFHGYLPIKDAPLKAKLVQMERALNQQKQSQIWIETPYRNDRLLKVMIQCLKGNTKLCIATEINGDQESIKTQTINEWKKSQHIIGKKNTVFLLG